MWTALNNVHKFQWIFSNQHTFKLEITNKKTTKKISHALRNKTHTFMHSYALNNAWVKEVTVMKI